MNRLDLRMQNRMCLIPFASTLTDLGPCMTGVVRSCAETDAGAVWRKASIGRPVWHLRSMTRMWAWSSDPRFAPLPPFPPHPLFPPRSVANHSNGYDFATIRRMTCYDIVAQHATKPCYDIVAIKAMLRHGSTFVLPPCYVIVAIEGKGRRRVKGLEHRTKLKTGASRLANAMIS